MALPQFNKITNQYYNNIDPVQLSEFDVKFENKFLADNCTSIKIFMSIMMNYSHLIL